VFVYHPDMRSCKAIIYLHNLYYNIKAIKDFTRRKAKLCLAAKADGYGHGAAKIARTAIDAGIDSLAVNAKDEAIELREAGITEDILILGLAPPGEILEIVKHGLSAVVADEDMIDEYARAARVAGSPARLHLKVDTGMGRIGCDPDAAPSLARKIASTPELKLEGICSHFPVADASDKGYTSEQIRRFSRCIDAVREAGIAPGTVHIANSAGLQRYPESWFDMVRVGIAAYGYPGGPEANPPLPLQPVMELRAPVSFIKTVPAGTHLSYGHTYMTTRKTVIATVSAGYADGYRRALSNRGRVLLNGECYPVVGTVCMDQLLVDLGPRPDVKLYDEAVLFGPDGRGPDAAELASLLGTVPYEITCGISARVPREYRE